ncbi:glycosyltransferase [Oscillatoria sp. FACHB-1407]|uniref:glycosyltransferase n=1 Tax=Oscillatoria sp. FACHB-1407 TaxID=2692847 RepID=UPI001683D546|nr:glycosyltransferase [Oscillatoria sp. FACHB-1407]MBD2459685.1 glycosyltransferase [Oscillatoria sp. FACHB-1407]
MVSSRIAQPSVAVGQEAKKLMLFDLDYRGHHAGYIQHLVTYWCDHNLPGQLDVLVSPKFTQQHSKIIDRYSSHPNLQFVSIHAQDYERLVDSAALETSFTGRIKRAFQEWNILQKYTKSLGTDHCLLMYFDTVFLRFAFGGTLPCPFSSIYFRPLFHYPSFANYTPAGREQVWQWRDRVCLAKLLSNQRLQTLFCLDPFAVAHLNQLDKRSRAVFLQDPVRIYHNSNPQSEHLRQELGIQSGRKVFLLFGALSERKGMFQVLDAIASLPPQICEQICLLLVGPIQPPEKEALQARIQDVAAAKPVQIVAHHAFISDEAIQPYFDLSDVILAPYQRHIGMSAILVRAAAAQKPVLSSDFGLMGEITRFYKLGLAVDSTVPAEIAKGLSQCVLQPTEQIGDRLKMKEFAQQNEASGFASKIFQHLMTVPTGA